VTVVFGGVLHMRVLSAVMVIGLGLLCLPVQAVTMLDQPLMPEMTYAPMMNARIKAPVIAESREGEPIFRTVQYTEFATRQVTAKPLLTPNRKPVDRYLPIILP
jgi:hypothetical protein